MIDNPPSRARDGNRLRPSSRWIEAFPIRSRTTEFQVMTPQVDLTPMRAQAAGIANDYAAQREDLFTLRHDLTPTVAVEAANKGSEAGAQIAAGGANALPTYPDSAWYARWHRAPVETAEPETSGAPALFEALDDWLPASRPANAAEAVPLSPNAVPDTGLPAPAGRGRLTVILEEMARTAREGQERLTAHLDRAAEHLDALISPPPRWERGAVPVRGGAPVRTRGALQGQEESVRGVTLDEAWEPERTLRLSLEEQPQIQAGRLQLVLRGTEGELAGRQANLVVETDQMELALGSAPIEALEDDSGWALAFDIDLEAAGLTIKEGQLPPRALRLVIEPPRSSTPIEASGDPEPTDEYREEPSWRMTHWRRRYGDSALPPNGSSTRRNGWLRI